MAWRILFSFKVCSTCFNLTTWKRKIGLVKSQTVFIYVFNSLFVCLIFSWHSVSCSPCAGPTSPSRSCPSPRSWSCQSPRARLCSKHEKSLQNHFLLDNIIVERFSSYFEKDCWRRNFKSVSYFWRKSSWYLILVHH